MTLAQIKHTKWMQILCQPLSLVLWLLVASFAAHTVAAQTFSASIAGTVTDSSGAVVSGTNVRLQNTATNDVREQKSGANGSYNFTALLPGTYKITATAAGFETYVRTGLILEANTAATVDVALQVGKTQQQVVVTASTVLVDTESATNSVTMDQALLEALPNNTLQPLNFIFDLAGTTEAQGGMTSRSSFLDQMGSMFGINGGRTGESEILVDGAPSTAIDWGGMMVSPINDSVQEQQVIDNVYDAQYERGGEGVVTLITKGGGPTFHGSAYDYMQNDGLNANTWSNNFSDVPRGKFHRNQFGADTGGPIWRKHNLFFFGGYEGLRQPETDSSGLQTMPTAAEVGGDFSQSYLSTGQPDLIYNPFTTRLVTATDGTQYYTRDPFPGNKITSGVDPVGQKIAQLYPAPNHASAGPNDENNFVKQGGGDTADDKFDVRVDWAQSEKHRLFVRVSDRARQDNTPACFLCNGGDEGYATQDHGEQAVINDTITPNSKWLINLYGAYSRWFEGQTLLGFGKSSSAIGLNPSMFQVNTLPLVNVAGYYTLGNQYSTFDRYIRYNSTGIANVSRQLHAHTLRFGFNYDIAMINNREDQPGVFNFSTAQTSCDPHTDANGNPDGQPCVAQVNNSEKSGNAIASLLIGAGSGGDTTISMDPAMSQHSFGMYIQDEWRATPKLTVNAGLRYENQRPATERYNRIAYFDLSAINPLSAAFGSNLYGQFEYAGVGGRGRGAWEPDNLNFGPRLGLAYRFTDKLAARVGSGIFYGPASAMLSFDGGGQSPGYTAQTNWIATNNGGYTVQNVVSNPYPQGIQQPTGNSLGAMTYVGYGTGQLWPKLPHPIGTLYQWSADIQYQVNPHSVAEIGYTGVRGRKLLFGNPNFDLDQMPDKDLSLGNQLNNPVPNPYAAVITDPNSYLSQSTLPYNELLRPFPEYTYLQQTRSLPGARSQFDALTAKYTWSFSNGLSSITSYQWSKNLDDGSEALIGWAIGNMWRDATNPKLDYAISTHDVPQSFAEAFLYQLPYGHGRQFGASSPGAVNQVLGGWNLSGAIRLSSGLPLFNPVNYGWNPLGNFGFPGNAVPNVIGDPRAHRSVSHWYNEAAFQGVTSSGSGVEPCGGSDQCQPFNFSFGNEPQRMSTLREAETKNLDLGIGKEFGAERVKAEFRGDFLNAFNHPIYGGSWNIQENLYASDFGQVYSTRNDPRTVQVSLTLRY